MNAQTFSLGTISFTGWEVTENLCIPRRTAASFHDIPQTDDSAAERIAQTFGTFPDAIELNGTFRSATADDDLRALEALQDSQQVVTFTSGARSLDVIISEIKPEYYSAGEINFKVTLEPLVDLRGASGSPDTDPSGVMESNLDTLDALTTQIPGTVSPVALDPSVTSNLQLVQSQRSGIGTISLATIQQQISFAQTLYTAIQSTQNALDTLRETSGASNMIQLLEQVSGSLSGTYRTLQTYIGTANNSKTVRVPVQTSAYQIAADYTGDWSNFGSIMEANGLADPQIAGGTTIVIPPL